MDLQTLLKPYRADIRRTLVRNMWCLLEKAGVAHREEQDSTFSDEAFSDEAFSDEAFCDEAFCDERFSLAWVREQARKRFDLDVALEARYWLSDLEYPGFKEDAMQYISAFYSGEEDASDHATFDVLERVSTIFQPALNHHIRGYVLKRLYYLHGASKGLLLPPREMKRPRGKFIPAQGLPRECTFHFQPARNAYSDIPSFEDLFAFLRFRHKRHLIAGREFFSALEKTDRTSERVLDLFDWEEEPIHRYQLERMRRRHSSKYKDGGDSQSYMDVEHECRERYAKLALRAIGLRFPAKMSKRRKHWAEILQTFGIEVHQIRRTTSD